MLLRDGHPAGRLRRRPPARLPSPPGGCVLPRPPGSRAPQTPRTAQRMGRSLPTPSANPAGRDAGVIECLLGLFPNVFRRLQATPTTRSPAEQEVAGEANRARGRRRRAARARRRPCASAPFRAGTAPESRYSWSVARSCQIAISRTSSPSTSSAAVSTPAGRVGRCSCISWASWSACSRLIFASKTAATITRDHLPLVERAQRSWFAHVALDSIEGMVGWARRWFPTWSEGSSASACRTPPE